MLTKTAQEEKISNEPDIYRKLVSDLLFKVQKPGQYLGIEYGRAGKLKKWSEAEVKTALVFPDLYEIGMANFGTKILYQIINSKKEYLCDRAYAPLGDMEELMRKDSVSLWGWESFKPLKDFDLLGFSLSYELSCTNVLNLLSLSHLEVCSEKRKETFPLVFAGGPVAFNPEPMADFFDFFIIGDGEEVILEILDVIKKYKNKISKTDLLLKLANISGVYVPEFYVSDKNKNYLPEPLKEYKDKVPEKIKKRVVSLDDYNQPVCGPVPYLASVQDRQVLEIRRGCDRGCRFCQPGYVYLPVRERTPDDLIKLSSLALKNTGYDEYSLLSLSSSDYTCLHETTVKLNTIYASKGISLSMPSQRADRFDLEIAKEINTVRKSGITLAPEAGTERLRKVINKGLSDNEIKKAIENVYDGGFYHVKLYFMIGLPTEAKEDLDGIIELLRWASDLSKKKNKKPLEISCTISTFVPKAFTPFGWVSQNTKEEFSRKINYLKQEVKNYRLRNVKLNCTAPDIAMLEAVISRGDRRMSKLIYLAYQMGAKFDAWNEFFKINLWHDAARTINLDLQEEAIKQREIGALNPWDIIDSGILNKFLVEEYKNALEVRDTESCTENKCHACGVCFNLNVVNEVAINKSNNNKFVKEITKKSTSQPSSSKLKTYPIQSVQKYEIVHTKIGDLRFISHLDVQRLFERALRRADISFAFTCGFNPRPKIQWLMPLPLYYESNHELLFLELSDYVKDSDLQIMLNLVLPQEFQLKSTKSVGLDIKSPDPNNIKVLYRILTYKPLLWEKYIRETRDAIESFLAQDSLILKTHKKSKNPKNKFGLCESKKEKELDIRALVEGIKILNLKPLEFEFVLIGNTRAELVLNEITKKVLPVELQSELNDWQLNWKITKEMIMR